MSIHIYAMTDIETKHALVRGLPGEVYETFIQSQVRCDWSSVTRTWSVRKERLGDLRAAFDMGKVRYTEHATGKPPAAGVTRERAQYLVAAIRSGLAGLHPMVIEAYEGRAWDPLGYTSWKALCEAEFALTLAIPQRREAVAEMTEAGLSTRAQADVLGVDQRTVNRDQDQVRQNASPETPTIVVGKDGKVYPGRRTAYSSRPAGPPIRWQDDAAGTPAPTGGIVEGRVLAPDVPQWAEPGPDEVCVDATITLLQAGIMPARFEELDHAVRLVRSGIRMGTRTP